MILNIAILGGTFDPIHNGHLMLAQAAYLQYALDEVWFLPNAKPPHKDAETIESTIEDRLKMVELAIRETDYFRLIDYEAKKETISYTYETMKNLKEKYPEHTFSFIIGADSLFAFETWMHPEEILKTCRLLAACREDAGSDTETEQQIRYLNDKYHSDIELLTAPHVPVSSTQIRQRRKEGLSISGLVPKDVENYILEEKLYEV